jgi:hypothetical protein
MQNPKEKHIVKTIKYLIAAGALFALPAYAVEPEYAMSCEEASEEYKAKPDAAERFADLKGTCEGVYRINGALYARAQAVVRSASSSKVRLYLPATDRTIESTPDSDMRVHVGGQKLRVRDLDRGDEIGIYLSLDAFFEDRVEEIAFATEDSNPEPIAIAPIQEVAALPTTASPLPMLALLSSLILGAGVFMRRMRRSA